MRIIRRLSGLLQRRRRARRFGVAYSRDKSWQTPEAIRIEGKMATLYVPKDAGTRIAFKDIFLEDVYGLRTVEPPPRTILDVGGHAGLFGLYARSLFPKATIHCYEPNGDLKKYLEHQAMIGGFTPYGEAVAGESAKARLLIGKDSVFTKTVNDAEGEIPVVSIDRAIDRLGGHVDVLKLDCEGCEWSILEKRFALKGVSFLTMEYHLSDRQTLGEMMGLVTAADFEIVLVKEDAPNNGRIWARH